MNVRFFDTILRVLILAHISILAAFAVHIGSNPDNWVARVMCVSLPLIGMIYILEVVGRRWYLMENAAVLSHRYLKQGIYSLLYYMPQDRHGDWFVLTLEKATVIGDPKTGEWKAVLSGERYSYAMPAGTFVPVVLASLRATDSELLQAMEGRFLNYHREAGEQIARLSFHPADITVVRKNGRVVTPAKSATPIAATAS
ncbi:MAG: hypothetical protein V4438_00840 [Patescibacteria group bacterium]